MPQISYGYGGRGNMFLRLAGTAEVREGERILGSAALHEIHYQDRADGTNLASLLEVHETHFSPIGTVTYKGKLVFAMPFGNLVKEQILEGTKARALFDTWPAGM